MSNCFVAFLQIMFCVGVYDLNSDTGYLSTRDMCNISPAILCIYVLGAYLL
jgi:hypothetical protein